MFTASALRDHHSEPLHVPYSFREVNGYRFTKHVNTLKAKHSNAHLGDVVEIVQMLPSNVVPFLNRSADQF
jgi:hypothetical protein